jgi:hypothetical protein
MQESVVIHGNTWKLADISEDIAWCKGLSWQSSRYIKIGDHNHCSICWWTMMVSDDPSVGQGHVADINHFIWLCSECYDKFIAIP